MINTGRRLSTFSNRIPLDGSRPDAPYCSEKKPLPTGRDMSAKQRLFRPILPQDRTMNDWRTIAWPTNTQSKTPDGQFGPAKQMPGWSDCWFLASLGAVANDEAGRQLLAGSIKQVTIEGINGYSVTLKGMPDHTIFISDETLNKCVDQEGGDADTRLMQLAADKYFSISGRFFPLYIAHLLSSGMGQGMVEQCVNQFCRNNNVQDPKNFNPMRDGCLESVAFFMLTGIFPDILQGGINTELPAVEIMAYLNRHATNDQGGTSIAVAGIENPLGTSDLATDLVEGWDLLRTEITSNGTIDAQAQAFLNALDAWLKTPDDKAWQVLRSAAANLTLQNISPVAFVLLLDINDIALRQNHRDRLRSGVLEVLGEGIGYIGLPGEHSETIEGINTAQNTFTYSDPNAPTVVHTGELSGLIQAIASGGVALTAPKPTNGQDKAETSHAGEQRGRHLLAFHQRAVNDGKIDAAEIGPLANLMAMDDGAFRHVYDSDHNGVIQGGELKAVQRRVDRWVNHLNLTPIW